MRSLVDTSDHSEVRLQSDQLGLINCFHEAPFWRKAASRMDPLAEETGVDGFKALLGFFFFFYKAHDVQQKKERKEKHILPKRRWGR